MFAALNSKFNFKVNNKLHVHLGWPSVVDKKKQIYIFHK